GVGVRLVVLFGATGLQEAVQASGAEATAGAGSCSSTCDASRAILGPWRKCETARVTPSPPSRAFLSSKVASESSPSAVTGWCKSRAAGSRRSSRASWPRKNAPGSEQGEGVQLRLVLVRHRAPHRLRDDGHVRLPARDRL